jgi:hypothetical protein
MRNARRGAHSPSLHRMLDPFTSPPIARMPSSVEPNSCSSRAYDFSPSIVYKTEMERST